MAETLSQKQRRFSVMVAGLMAYAFSIGYEITFGDAFRDPRVHGDIGVKLGYGHPKSCHKLRLAIDLNLWKDGAYLTKTEDYKVLGEYWEKQGGTWGGRFEDGNHFSLEHQGMK